MKLALEGIRILDLTRLIPGPFCTMILADLGAEVIKIEEPRVGDYERQIKPIVNGMAYRFMLLNRNKKSVGLNLKAEDGRRIFLDLVRRADVVVEGFRPGAMTKLGLDYSNLKEVKPDIVYCSISSYGHSGPAVRQVAHDINILAQIGLLDLIGAAGGPPVVPGVQIVDTVAALYAVIGIQAALTNRTHTGRGQQVDISMHDCAFSLMFDNARYPLGEKRLPQRGSERLSGGLAHYNIYQTKDGQHIALGAIEQKFKNRLLEKLGLDAFIEKTDAVTTSEVDPDKEATLKKRLGEIIGKKDLGELNDLLAPENICFSPILNVEEALKDPQLAAREMVVEARHPVAGGYTQLGSPLKLSGSPPDIGRLPAPRLGEHTREVATELGLSEDEINRLINRKVICVD